MTTLEKKLAVLSVVLFAIFGFIGYKFSHTKSFGSIPQTPALFETSLSIPQTTSDTSMTLASVALKNGASLSGYYCFTLDSNTSLTEYECGTASTTSAGLITGITRGVDPVNGTSSVASLIFSHRAGADVRITDFPAVQQFANIFNGTQGIGNPILYSGVATSTLQLNNNYLASVGYVNSIAISGAPNASLSQNGIVQQATALQLAGSVNSGSTGAILFAPGGVFASSSSATTLVPVTQTNGKLNANFIDQTASYTWTGLVVFNSATTTLNATTSIASSAANKLILNTIPYVFPTSQGGASTTLTNNGSGILSWQPGFSFATNSPGSINNNFSSTTSSTVLSIMTVNPSAAQRFLVTGVYNQLSNSGNDNGCQVELWIDSVNQAIIAKNHQLITTAVPAWSGGGWTYVTSQLSAGNHIIDIRGIAITGGTCTLSMTQLAAFNAGN